MNTYSRLLDYEAAAMEQAEVLAMFSALITTGDIWKLPTTYLDAAAFLINNGHHADTTAKRGVN